MAPFNSFRNKFSLFISKILPMSDFSYPLLPRLVREWLHDAVNSCPCQSKFKAPIQSSVCCKHVNKMCYHLVLCALSSVFPCCAQNLTMLSVFANAAHVTTLNTRRIIPYKYRSVHRCWKIKYSAIRCSLFTVHLIILNIQILNIINIDYKFHLLICYIIFYLLIYLLIYLLLQYIIKIHIKF